jgi:hypothetical protein
MRFAGCLTSSYPNTYASLPTRSEGANDPKPGRVPATMTELLSDAFARSAQKECGFLFHLTIFTFIQVDNAQVRSYNPADFAPCFYISRKEGKKWTLMPYSRVALRPNTSAA